MKVQGTNGVNPIQAYQKHNSHKGSDIHRSKNRGIDEVQISTEAQSLLSGEIENSDPVKLDRIKKEVQEGNYQVNSKAVAEKIYNSWFE